MTSHRNILFTLILLTAISVAMTSSALAGPLLGGYGGPGEGNQAILGSALLGGAGSGGSSGSSGGSSGSAGSSPNTTVGAGTQTGRSQADAAPPGSSGHGSTAGEVGRRSAGGASHSPSGSGKASGGVARAYPVLSGDRVASSPSASETLGLSGADLAYVLLALCVLVGTGVLTRRLAQAAGPLKVHNDSRQST
jgi:hypothetical protein